MNSAYFLVRNVQSFICFQNKPVSELESFFLMTFILQRVPNHFFLACKVYRATRYSSIPISHCNFFQPFISLLFQRDTQIHSLKRNFKYSNMPILMLLTVFQSSSHKNKIFKNFIMSLIRVHTSMRWTMSSLHQEINIILFSYNKAGQELNSWHLTKIQLLYSFTTEWQQHW